MRAGRIVGSGVVAGMLSAVVVAVIGRGLHFSLPPWDWSSRAGGSLGRSLELSWAIAALVPVMVIAGIVTAVACALVLELITRRAGWVIGGIIGLFAGTIAFSVLGLLPWAASWYGYAYLPIVAPFGRSDPAWPFVLIVAVGAAMGVIAGALYGAPVHAGSSPHRIRWRQIYPDGARADQ